MVGLETREDWDRSEEEPCGVCGLYERRNIDGETKCEEQAHVAYLLTIYPNWEGYNGTY